MKRKTPAEMSGADLGRAAREFDDPGEPRFLRAPAAVRRRHDTVLRKIKRARGRPRVGAGVKRIQITMERSLLQQTDEFARSHRVTRSQLIAQCLWPVVSRKSA